MQHKQKQFVDKVLKPSYWDRKGEKMKFDAVVGNPPYQIMDGGAQASARPVYNLFVEQAEELKPNYVSMIMPARWYAGGKGLDDFRNMMLSDIHIKDFHDFLNPDELFPGTNIRGGLCFFLWDSSYNNTDNLTLVHTHNNNKIKSIKRHMHIEG